MKDIWDFAFISGISGAIGFGMGFMGGKLETIDVDARFYQSHECESLHHVRDLQKLVGSGVSQILLISAAEATKKYDSEKPRGEQYSPISPSNPIVITSDSEKKEWKTVSVNISNDLVYDYITLYKEDSQPNIRKPLTCIYDAPKGRWRNGKLDTIVDTSAEKLRDMLNAKIVTIVPERGR